uniref:Uncharacterized protein n=1 Tax=Cannabis sativa TaxID=3483 RepID=A0A803Q443_CANSA
MAKTRSKGLGKQQSGVKKVRKKGPDSARDVRKTKSMDKMIAYVDNERARDWINGEPLIFEVNLKAFNFILKQKSEKTIVGVWRHS